NREKELYLAFTALTEVSREDARRQIADLERAHAQRREWVWAGMGESPLALALEHLAQLAVITNDMKFGGTALEQAERYANTTWRADDAVVRALELAADRKSSEAVTAV